VDQQLIVQRSYLAASRTQVWATVSTLAGANRELRPFLRMTSPRGVKWLDPSVIPLGVPAFYSLFLLFGVLPIDYGDVTFSWLETDRGFVHRSSTLMLQLFQHERVLEDTLQGCSLTDRLIVHPRLPITGPIVAGLVRYLFGHRHRRLRARFGGRTLPPDRVTAF
jgi:hypothetical protein